MFTVNKESMCYILFGKELIDIVKGIDDNIQEMWKRFYGKYGDLVKVVDVI